MTDNLMQQAAPAALETPRGIDAANLPALLSAAPVRQLLGLLMDRAPPFWLAASADEIMFSNRAYQDLAGHRLLPNQRLALPQVLATGGSISIQDDISIDGEARHFRTHLYPVPNRSGVKQSGAGAVAGLMVDATKEIRAFAATKAEKQRFQDVIRSTSDWVWETDRDGVLTFVSDRATEALGMPAAMLRGRRFTDLSGDPAPSGGMAQSDNPRSFRDASLRVAGSNGEIRQFSLAGVPVYDEQGRFSGYRGTASDVTARLDAEAALREHQGKLEIAMDHLRLNNFELEVALNQARAAFESKNEFLATISHELRTPLNAIIGFSETITAQIFGAIDRRYAGYVSDIGAAGQQLLGMVENILTLAQTKESSIQLELTSAPIGPILGQALAKVMKRAADKGLHLASIPDYVGGKAFTDGPLVKLDVERAREILIQLLDNAVKFTPTGGAIGVVVEQPRDGRLDLTIWDTGPGIPEKSQSLIFDTFQQVHDSIYRRGFEGIGAGLALARELARAMGGDVTLLSSSAQGSRFSVSFQLARAEA
jgi:PAS domain S-box-containing protein